jgi:hypothetical protein
MTLSYEAPLRKSRNPGMAPANADRVVDHVTIAQTKLVLAVAINLSECGGRHTDVGKDSLTSTK